MKEETFDHSRNINVALTEIDDYFKCAFSVDCVIFGFENGELKVLLIESDMDPFKGMFSLVGDLVHPREDLDAAAKRILQFRTGLENIYQEQVHTFGRVDRHPLGRVISVAYYSLVKISDYQLRRNGIAANAEWCRLDEIGELAFDHNKILNICRRRLKRKVQEEPIGFNLLPRKFTLTKLQELYEAVLDKELDKRNFRKKILNMDLLIDLNELQKDVAHRPAKLYSFDEEKYEGLLEQGFTFGL